MTRRLSSIPIRAVARRAGVSTATVSRYVHRSAAVSPEIAEQLDKVITALRYAPPALVCDQASTKTRVVGLLLNSPHNDFFVPLLNGVDAVVRQKGYNLIVATHRAMSRDHLCPPIGPHNTDGLLVFSDSLSDDELASWNAEGFPMVLIHRTPPPQAPIPSINVENHESARRLVEHLIKVHGKQHIMFLRGSINPEDSKCREAGYRSALEANGIPIDEHLMLNGDFERDIAYVVMNEFLGCKTPAAFDAVFTGDDDAAIGVLKSLHEHGIRVPQDVAVVGFNDLGFASFSTPPLTTVRAPTEKVGQIATERLFGLLENHPCEEVTTLPTEIIFRRSCGCELA